MVTRTPASAIGTGTDPLYVLDGADDLWLDRSNYLIATGPGQHAISVEATPAGEARSYRIDGVALGHRALAMATTSQADVRLAVGETGYLGSDRFGGVGALLYGAALEAEVRGTVTAPFSRGFGLALAPTVDGKDVTVVNSATIAGFEALYVLASGRTGITLTIDNSGLIEGVLSGIRVFGNPTTQITNTGTIYAPVHLGGGDDLFFGLHGELFDNRASSSFVNGAIYGGGGNDTLILGAGNQNLFGGAGDDTLHGGAGADRLDGGEGFDVASYAHARAGVRASLEEPALNTGDAAGDVYVSIEGLRGSRHADELVGNGGDNRLWGAAGDDLLFGGHGNDSLWGGDGDDQLYGGAGDDRLDGGEGDDRLFGGTGSNVLRGGAGDDLLVSEGDDRLFGGEGADQFVFAAAPGTGLARVRDFEQGVDRLVLDAGVFGLEAGALDPALFALAGEVRTAATRVVYRAENGALLWDPDGRGGEAPVRIAVLAPGLALTADDFRVVAVTADDLVIL
jgi:Ca2+-binding RTX toxin-like protein